MIYLNINQKIGKKLPNSFWQKIARTTFKTLGIKKSLQISLAVVDAQTIKKLNKNYLGRNSVTDVLSFSELENKNVDFPAVKNYLGEVIICYPQAIKQAKAAGHNLRKELKILFIHGLLHLLGYDDEKKENAVKMRKMEERILNKTSK